MRRALLCTLAALQLLILAGPGGVRGNFREVEQLLVIQTLGLDGTEDGVELSMAAKGDGAGPVRRLKAGGSSISAAMERIRSGLCEQELFCAHAGRLLLGEKAAEAGIDAALGYLCRSPEMRLDMPLYILREGRASQALLEVGDESRGICDVMDSVDRAVKLRGDCGCTDAARVTRELERYGSALVCALRLRQASERGEEGSLLTVEPAGYAVLREGKLCRYLDESQALGAGLLRGESGVCEISVRDRAGRPAVLELEGGGCTIRAVWDEGALTGLRIRVKARASVLEQRGAGGEEDADALTARLEERLAESVSACLTASKELKADFLGLQSLVERSDPAAYARLDRPFPELLPELTLEVTVSATLDHARD